MDSCTPYPTNCVAENVEKCYGLFLLIRKSLKRKESIFCLSFYACPGDLNIFYAALNQSTVCFNAPMGIQYRSLCYINE